MDQSVGLTQNLERLLNELVRGQASNLDAHLTKVKIDIPLEETNAKVHCHAIALDSRKLPRINDFAKFLAGRIIDYSIPRREIDRAKKYLEDTGSTAKFSELNKKAAGLFTEIKNSGEGGELLLFLLLEHFLKLPQVICKMSLKTNPNVHYHGVDGIHASLGTEPGSIALYWGESKLYADVSAAITDCFDSLKPFLTSSGGSGSAIQRDIHLLQDNIENINKPELEEALLKFLDPDDPLYKKLEFRGACLIGFDNSAYPNQPNEKTEQVVCSEIADALGGWLKSIRAKTKNSSLETFILEVFLIPFPSVEKFRDAFASEIGVRDSSTETAG